MPLIPAGKIMNHDIRAKLNGFNPSDLKSHTG